MLLGLRLWLFPRVETTVIEAALEEGAVGETDGCEEDEKHCIKCDETEAAHEIHPSSQAPTSSQPELILIFQDDDIEVWAEKPSTPAPLVRTASIATASTASLRSCATTEASESGLPPPKRRRLWDFWWLRVLLLFVMISISWVGLVVVGLYNSVL